MSPSSSPRSPKSDPIEEVKEVKEDAETTATRKELRNTTISGVFGQDDGAKTPDDGSESAGEKKAELKDGVLSPKKKRARDQLDDDKAPEAEVTDTKEAAELKVDPPSPKRKKRHGQAVEDLHLGDEAVKSKTPHEEAAVLHQEHVEHEGKGEDSRGGNHASTQHGVSSPAQLETPELGAQPQAQTCVSHKEPADRELPKDRGSRSEPEKKRHRDELSPPSDAVVEKGAPRASTEETAKTKIGTGAAVPTASEADKTGTLANSKFLNSGFAQLKDASSPFGALGSSTKGSVFGSGSGAKSGFGSIPASSSAVPAPTLDFKSKDGPSPFGSLPPNGVSSPFGGVGGGGFGGGGFGSGFGGGPKPTLGAAFGSASGARLTSFAKPGETFGSSTKKAKPFGAPDSDDDEGGESNDEDGDVSASDESDKAEQEDAEKKREEAKVVEEKKRRLQMVEVNDGEDGEATVLQVRAKLYYIDRDNTEAGWRERGAGILKVNVPDSCVTFDDAGMVRPGSFDASGLEEAAEGGSTKVVRLIMRQDQTHKLLLNTALLPAMRFQEKTTLKSNMILFTALEGSKDGGSVAIPISMSMRMTAANARLFLDEVELIQRELQSN